MQRLYKNRRCSKLLGNGNWKNWQQWQVNVKYLEELMPDYNFFSNIPQEIRDSLREDSSSNPFNSDEEILSYPDEDNADNSLTANPLSEESQEEFSNLSWHFPGSVRYNLPVRHNGVFQDIEKGEQEESFLSLFSLSP